MQPFIDSSPLSPTDPRSPARMQRDGYLFLPGLLPREDVATVQRQIGEIARDAGWLRRDTPVQHAIADPSGFCVDPDPTYLNTLRRINRLEDYHALKHHPVLIDLLERMLGGPILPHPRVLMRNIFPARDEYTTKAHQDFPNVQGTTEVYTAWMPLIDCPMDVGPLQIAVGSHTKGVYDFGIAGGAGGIEIKDPLKAPGPPATSPWAMCCCSIAWWSTRASPTAATSCACRWTSATNSSASHSTSTTPIPTDNRCHGTRSTAMAIRRAEILLATPAPDAEAVRPTAGSTSATRWVSNSARPATRAPAPCCNALWRAMPTRRSEPARNGCSTRCRDRVRRSSLRPAGLHQRRGAAAGRARRAARHRGACRRADRRPRPPVAALVQPAGQSVSVDRAAPRPAAARNVEIGFIAALAVADAIDALLPRQERATLKWPNDVLVRDGKIAGILAEQAGEAMILGIGLNVLHAPGGVPYKVSTIVGCGGLATVDGTREAADGTGDLDRRLAAGRLRADPQRLAGAGASAGNAAPRHRR